MFYDFPLIEKLDDVLPAIEGRSEFIVAEREGFTVVNYVVAMDDTFPPVNDKNSAIRRECRGIIFDQKTGIILRRPLIKFFNINEREETQLNNLNFNFPHKVFTKLDGSFIAPFEKGLDSNNFCFGTKMGETDVSKQVENFVNKHPNYLKFSCWCIDNKITPTFEWTSRQQRIVIDYPEDKLTLIACRHMITGKFLEF